MYSKLFLFGVFYDFIDFATSDVWTLFTSDIKADQTDREPPTTTLTAPYEKIELVDREELGFTTIVPDLYVKLGNDDIKPKENGFVYVSDETSKWYQHFCGRLSIYGMFADDDEFVQCIPKTGRYFAAKGLTFSDAAITKTHQIICNGEKRGCFMCPQDQKASSVCFGKSNSRKKERRFIFPATKQWFEGNGYVDQTKRATANAAAYRSKKKYVSANKN